MEQLYKAGVVGPEENTFTPREILMTEEEFKNFIKNYNPKENETVNTNAVPGKTNPDSSTFIKTHYEALNALGIITDYNSKINWDNLENSVIPKTNDSVQFDFINNIIKYISPATARLILLDMSGFIYRRYDGIGNLLIPVITDKAKMIAALNWTFVEMSNRINVFLQNDAQSIEIFNQKTSSQMPRIIVILNEAYGFPVIQDEWFSRLLLNSTRMGIYILMFSRLPIQSLNIENKELLNIRDWSTLNALFSRKSLSSLNLIEIDDLEGHKFEKFCADLLSRNGFENVSITPGSGDQGIDIIAYKDNIKYGIQCKCYSNDIGNKAIQEAFSGKTHYKCHVAAVLTNRHFTPSAKELAEDTGVLLWDRDYLQKLISNQGKN